MQRWSTAVGGARRLRLLLLCALATACALLEVDARASRASLQLPAQLEALAHELQERATHAADEREALRARLAAAQQLLVALFAGEREEAESFARETRARMQQLRRELGSEMARARGDLTRRVDAAVRNVSALTQRREAARRANEQQLLALRTARHEQQQRKEAEAMRRRQQQQEGEEEEERRAREEADARHPQEAADAQAQAAVTNTTLTAETLPVATLLESAADATRWLWSLVLVAWRAFWRWVVPTVLVLGGALLVAVAVAKAVQLRRARRRVKGVLYSRYLKPKAQQQQLERRRRRTVSQSAPKAQQSVGNPQAGKAVGSVATAAAAPRRIA